MSRYVFDFSDGSKELRDLLGGKGANLAEMTRMGLPVPPGFTVTTDACREYLLTGHVPAGLLAEVEDHLRLVEARLADHDLSPATLAAELGLSLRTLQAATARCGITPLSHIMRRRLERAAELLILEPDKQVIQIAYDCGFADSSYFARQFQKRYGLSPRHYRLRR